MIGNKVAIRVEEGTNADRRNISDFKALSSKFSLTCFPSLPSIRTKFPSDSCQDQRFQNHKALACSMGFLEVWIIGLLYLLQKHTLNVMLETYLSQPLELYRKWYMKLLSIPQTVYILWQNSPVTFTIPSWPQSWLALLDRVMMQLRKCVSFEGKLTMTRR